MQIQSNPSMHSNSLESFTGRAESPLSENSMSDQVTMRIDHPIMRNHCVYGQHMLPGLAYVDLLFQIFRKHGHDYRELELRNLIIFEPLVVAEDYDVVLDIRAGKRRNRCGR